MGLWAFAVFPIMNSGSLLLITLTMHRANFHRDDVWAPGGFAQELFSAGCVILVHRWAIKLALF